jgi:hypothetical protein
MARDAREEAFQHIHPRFAVSPIRDHAGNRQQDYTTVFKPEGKLSMLQGGIGSVRLKPLRIFDQPHWLMTASSDGVVHTGIPLAIPLNILRSIRQGVDQYGGIVATLTGECEFVPDPFSRLFDHSVMVPRVLIRVKSLHPHNRPSFPLENSVAVSFVSEYQGPPRIYATYVTYRPDIEGSFADAISWMKTEYVEGEYRGRIITDFDQTRTIFPEAKLALSKVMDRLISRGELRETIELMHASASVDSYFDEIAQRDLLPEKKGSHRKKIFISYAHAPEVNTGWVNRIRTHLSGLTHSSNFEVWDDSRIDSGQQWQREIERAISDARVAVLVLSADFLASQFVRETELPLLLEAADADGATILCVYGSDVHLSRGIGNRLTKYQFVNDPKKPLQAMSDTERESVYKRLTGDVEKALLAA